MATKSTHTKQRAQRRYAPGTSRGTRSASTLLAQVADVQRGERIRERREELHLTQPAVVDLLDAAAYKLPRSHDLHPDKAGKPPVTLRGFQTYEAGGGIVWEKAKLLAQVLQMDVQEMMSGERVINGGTFRQVDTPELLETLNGDTSLSDVLAELLAAVNRQNQLLARQSDILDAIEERLKEDRSVRDEIAAVIESRGRDVVQGLPEDAPSRKPKPRRSRA